MSSEKHAAALYRDFEKLYRLMSLYKGNLRQIEKQISYLENNLETHLREPFGRAGAVKFDFLMSAVFYNGEEVFRSGTPEFTISYALFCEGVKSLIFKGDLGVQELADWIVKIRAAIDGDSGGEDSDLASVFWRQTTPNIRVLLYNALVTNMTGTVSLQMGEDFELSDEVDDLENLIESEVLEMEFGVKKVAKETKSIAVMQDDAWDLPSGDVVVKKLAELGLQDPDVAVKLKRELSDAQISDRAKGILRFSRIELDHLREELDHFDENQVEFNMLVRYLSLLEQNESDDQAIYASVAEGLSKIIQSVLSRFHGGLILFLLKRMQKWKGNTRLEKIRGIVETRISKALQDQKNLSQLAWAFDDPRRANIAKDLLPFLSPKEFQAIVSILSDAKKPAAAERYLSLLPAIYPDLEQVPQLWNPEEIGLAVGVLSKLEWEGRDRFLARCLRSKDHKIAETAGEQVAFIHIDASNAKRLFSSLDNRLKRVWLQSFIRHPRQEAWIVFFRQALRTELWKDENEDLQALWVRACLKYLGREATESYGQYVSARRFVLWAKYPNLRTAILKVAMRMDEPEIQSVLREWASSEKNLFFQPADLKDLLTSVAR